MFNGRFVEKGRFKNNNKWKALGFCAIFVFCGIFLFAFLFGSMLMILNSSASLDLINYIKTFDAVEYDENRLIPEVQEEGFYTFQTDRELNILFVTDLHLGGGFSSKVNDKKAIYELICVLQQEKPDLVVLGGDNIYPLPSFANGGNTLNNAMVAKVLMELFEHEGVYYSLVFGNHDSENINFASRHKLAMLFQDKSLKYCIFHQDFRDQNETRKSETNQCILVKNSLGEITKALMLVDTNDYVDGSISSTLNHRYDTIHDEQVDWVEQTLLSLSEKNGSLVKSLFFTHIPMGEYATAFNELLENDFNTTENAQYVSGVWGESYSGTYGGFISYGGVMEKTKKPEECDQLFERIGPDGLNSMEAVFCGHDHLNSATVLYKGVYLSFGYSMDHLAYTGIAPFGKQRGVTLITIQNDGTWAEQHKNLYLDYDVEKDRFIEVTLDSYYNEEIFPAEV